MKRRDGEGVSTDDVIEAGARGSESVDSSDLSTVTDDTSMSSLADLLISSSGLQITRQLLSVEHRTSSEVEYNQQMIN